MLVRLDAEREPARRQGRDRSARGQDAHGRVARAGGADVACDPFDRHADHRHERSACQFSDRDLVRLREELAWIRIEPDERAEDELRKGHVGRGGDTVAARIPEHHCELPVGQRQEVVDVAADLDAGGRLVDGADVEALDLGQPAWEKRALHRVREVLLLLIEAGVVDREGGLPRDEESGLDRVLTDAPRRIEGDDRQRRKELGRGRNRDDDRSRALLEERDEQLVRRAEPLRAPRIEDERLAHSEEASAGKPLHDLVLREQRAQRPLETRICNSRRARDEQAAPLVFHPDHRGVGLEKLDGRARYGVERRVEGEALGEGTGDLVQRAQALCRLALCGKRLLPFACKALRALVQLGVLSSHGKLVRERGEEGRVVRRQLASPRQIGGEQPDELLARHERHRERRADPGFGDRLSNRREPDVGLRVGDVQHALRAERPERELEQLLGDQSAPHSRGRGRSRLATDSRRGGTPQPGRRRAVRRPE